MDKNIIKQYLGKTFLSEISKETASGTPGLRTATKIAKDNAKVNKAGVGEIGKDMNKYEKGLTKTDPNEKQMAPNKINYNSDDEKNYHDQMEIMNGQEMIQYDRTPNKTFKDRAMEAIEGSAKMGNNPKWANVVAKGQGGDPDFGKNLVKSIKASEKKRSEQTPTSKMFGDDWEIVSNKSHKSFAFEGTKGKSVIKENSNFSEYSNDALTDMIISLSRFEGNEDTIAHVKKELDRRKGQEAMKGLDADYEKDSRVQQYKNNENKKLEIKETMKRLKFKKEFNGVGNALKLIPESYKIDSKTFEMTDGNETYKIRWEGSLTEGKAVVLTAADKKMVSEDIQKMKHLFNYTSSSTLGTVKGKNRLDENKAFTDVWNKTKALLSESEEEGDEEDETPVKRRKDAYDASLDVVDPEDMEKSLSKKDIEKSTSEPSMINKDAEADEEDEDDFDMQQSNTELKLAKSTKTGEYAIITKINGQLKNAVNIPDEMAAEIKMGKMSMSKALAKIEADKEDGEMSDEDLMEAIMKMTKGASAEKSKAK